VKTGLSTTVHGRPATQSLWRLPELPTLPCRVSDPVYLVSRCSSIEEFVAAFRRYADRLGVFVPAGSPVAVGRKGRFAITLKDGRIVIDGDAEVIMSSARASGLHGRPGMTLRFTRVDDHSRAVLDHLEKVRFGAKVTVSSAHLTARPGPSTPDPGPPTPAKPGSDPAQTLAECAVIGDDVPAGATGPGSGPISGRRAPGSVPPPLGGPGASGKFAIPAIAPRTTSPVSAPVNAPVNAPPPMIASISAPVSAAPAPAPPRGAPARPIGGQSRPTMMGPAVSELRVPGPVSGQVAITGSGPVDGVPMTASNAVTVAGGAATVPTMSSPPASPEAVPIETPWLRHTTRGVAPPGLTEIDMGPATPVGRGSPPPGEKMMPVPQRMDPTPPPSPPVKGRAQRKEFGAEVAGLPQQHELPSVPAPAAVLTPDPPVLPARRPQPPKTRTMMGLQAIVREPAPPSSPGISIPIDHDEPALPGPPTIQQPVMSPSEGFDAGPAVADNGHASTVEIDPSLLEPTDAQVVVDPYSPTEDDGSAVVVSSPWPPPEVEQPRQPGWSPGPTGRASFTPLGGQPAHPGLPGMPDARPVTDAGSGFFENETGSQPRIGYVTDSNTGFFTETGAVPKIDGYVSEDMTALVQTSTRQKRLLVIVLSCLGVFVLGFVAILVIGGGSNKARSKRTTGAVVAGSGTASAGSAVAGSAEGSAGSAAAMTGSDDNGSGVGGDDGSGSAATAETGSGAAETGSGAAETGSGSGSDSGSAEVALGSGSGAAGNASGSAAKVGEGSGSGKTGTGKTGTGKVAAAPGECKVKVTSAPTGGEVMVAGKQRGKTPIELTLTCKATQISVRKTRYSTWTKTVRPTAKGIKVSARLARPTFTVKVSSVPSGASVSVGGKKFGKTPTVVKVPGFEPATITVAKDGFTSASEKVTAKQNGTAIKMTLRKK
jgi:hypothetical protein